MNEESSRKRRRRRTAATPAKISSARKRSIPLVQDVSFDLMHTEKETPVHNAPVLLHLMRRELGIWSRGSMIRWHERMLHDEERKGWRRFARRNLTFRQLQTPPEDAILGIDHTGSYAVALGGYSEREDEPLSFQDHGLFIRLYGLPSKARTIPFSHNLKGAPVSPLLHTIPVGYVVDDLWLHEMGLPAVLPTFIMLHRDGMIGAAQVGSLQSVASHHPYARIDDVITLFPLLRQKNRSRLVVRTLNLGKRSSNLEMYLFSAHVTAYRSDTCDSERSVPCKILIVHHGSIMRFCWILDSNMIDVSKPQSLILGGTSQCSTTEYPCLHEPIQLDIGKVRQLGQADIQWETKVYNLARSCNKLSNDTGSKFNDYDVLTEGVSEPTVEDEKNMQIFFELQFDAFFVCLEVRRLIQSEMGLSPECRKENTRNLFVCTHHDCRTVELILSFLVNPNDSSSRLSAFVTVDLSKSQLEVMKWVFKTCHEDAEKWLSSLRSLRLYDIREHNSTWSFLEQTNIDGSTKCFWKLKSEFSATDILPLKPPELDEVDILDNLDVLRHVPVDAFSHPMTSTRIVYSENAAART